MKKITIFTTSTCGPCGQLKSLLDHKQVPYETVVVDNSPEIRQELVEKTGYMIVPVTRIATESQEDWIAGYNPAKILQAIA